MNDILRAPPHSIEAEQAVLGALLMNAERLPLVKEIVTEEDFYRHDHRLIFEAVCKTRNPDAVTVGRSLEDEGLVDDIGGIGYLIELVQNTPGSGNVLAYARTVKDASDQRRCLHLGQQIMSLEGSGKERARKACELVRDFSVDADRDSLGLRPLATWGGPLIDQMIALADSESGMLGVPSYYSDIDRRIGGFRGGDLIICAGRPAMGKTAFALSMAIRQARKARNVAVFELEMAGQQLTQRAAQVIGHYDGDWFKDREKATDEDFTKSLFATMGEIKELPLYVDDRANVSVSDMHARIMRLAAEGKKPEIVFIDYLQLIRPDNRTENRTQDITQISRALKLLAKDCDVPVVALSQLNRGLEARADKRPTLHDLRESGSIEQDADVVMFLYRDDYYYPDGEENGGVVELITAKQRQGSTGTDLLTYIAPQTRFESFPRGHVYVPYEKQKAEEKKAKKSYGDFKPRAVQ